MLTKICLKTPIKSQSHHWKKNSRHWNPIPNPRNMSIIEQALNKAKSGRQTGCSTDILLLNLPLKLKRETKGSHKARLVMKSSSSLLQQLVAFIYGAVVFILPWTTCLDLGLIVPWPVPKIILLEPHDRYTGTTQTKAQSETRGSLICSIGQQANLTH